MRSGTLNLALVGTIAAATLGGLPATAAPRERACLLEPADGGGKKLGRPLARALERQLARRFQLSAGRAVEQAARTLRLDRRGWASPPGLPRLAKALRCRVPLVASLRPGLGDLSLTLVALDASTGEVRAEVGALTRGGNLGADELGRLVAELTERLRDGGERSAADRAHAGTDPTREAPRTVASGADTARGGGGAGGGGGEAPGSPAAPAGAERQAGSDRPDGTPGGGRGLGPSEDPWSAASEGFAPLPESSTGSGQAATSAGGGAGGVPGVAGALAAAARSVDATGRVRVEHFAYFSRGPVNSLPGRQSVEAVVRLAASHERVRASASLLGRADFADPSRNRFEPDVAWVEYRAPWVSLRAGRAVTSWGTASLYNPSDVVSPVDLRDPLATEKLGTLQVRALASLGPFTLEAIYLPVPELHRLPPIDGIDPDGRLRSRSRWLRGSVDVTGSAPLTFHVGPFTPPPPAVSNGQAAARLTAALLGADVSVGYAFLLDRVPSPWLEAVPASGSPLGVDVFVDWRARRLHVFSVDAERTFGKLRVALEGAAFLTADRRARDARVADPYWIANAGADLQTGAFAGDMRLHLFLELVVAGALAGELPREGLDLLRAPFPHSALARVAWELSDSLRVEANVVSDVTRFDVFASLRVEALIADLLKARLGVDLLAGDPDVGFFGPFRDNGRAVASVEANF